MVKERMAESISPDSEYLPPRQDMILTFLALSTCTTRVLSPMSLLRVRARIEVLA
jgi:hypothetical protein